jgi:hypothetical protein
MSHIAKLFLIFFLALITRANAGTTIICNGNESDAPDSPMAITYNEDGNGKISDFSIRDVAGCSVLTYHTVTEEQITFYCKSIPSDSNRIEVSVRIDRYTGRYSMIVHKKDDQPFRVLNGQCSKAKRKF